MNSFKTKTKQYFSFDTHHCIAGILIIPSKKDKVFIYVAWENEPAAQDRNFAVIRYEADVFSISIPQIIRAANYGTCMPEEEARKLFPNLF